MSENGDWPEEPAARVRELVEGVLDELDLEGEVEVSEGDDRIDAVVSGEDEEVRELLDRVVSRELDPASAAASILEREKAKGQAARS